MKKSLLKISLVAIFLVMLSLLAACKTPSQKINLTYSVSFGGEIVGEVNQCVEYGTSGTEVTAKAYEGYEFVEWSDGVTTPSRLDENITNDITVTAKFAKLTYTVSYTTDGNGKLQGEANQTVKFGENATTVTAVPDEGYYFVKWSDGVETASRTEKNVTANSTVTAEFEKINYIVRYVTDGNGIIEGKSVQKVPYNDSAATVTAVPDEGYYFVKWSDGVETASRTEKNVTANSTVTAEFKKITYTVTYLTDGNGTIEGESIQNIAYKDNAATITAIPNEGYKFVKWSDGIETASRTGRNVTADVTLTAEFKKITYTVTYLTDGNGTIEGESIQNIAYKDNAATITAIPNEGYKFVKWSDGVETATRTDKNIQAPILVTAIFEKKTFRVRYETNNKLYGLLLEEGAKYDLMCLEYLVAYGEDAPVVSAVVRQSELGESYTFLYWSDGITTEKRQDINITADLTVTAYYGYTIEYTVEGNIGGRIEGNTKQKLSPDGISEEVTAVPDQGYVFCGWSDLSRETERNGDKLEKETQQYYAVWEYVAYFEPIEKTFKYDYGIASGVPTATQITLNRNNIQSVEFVVPTYAGYKFCGWYADSDYRVRITTESGRYMYGYAAFSLETDTLYARWEKEGEETDHHKILLIFVDEIDANLRAEKQEIYFDVYDKMCALDYGMSKWINETIYSLLNDWFKGKVVFEVDAYFTTQIIGDDSFPIKGSNQLFATEIEEVFDIMYQYHNTITSLKYGCENGNNILINWTGLADIKNASVDMEDYWTSHPSGYRMPQKYLEGCKSGGIDLEQTMVPIYLHELTHTAEKNFELGYDLHTAREYAMGKYRVTSMENTIKPYLLGEFEMNGAMCGVPMEYWKHQELIHISYNARAVKVNGIHQIAGKVVAIGEFEDASRPSWRYVSYGSNFSIEALPKKGFRFVRWSDGVTTAIRHDVNVIAYIHVEAIFEKI